MKNIVLEFQDMNGEIINANELNICEGDRLVLQVDTSKLSLEQTAKWANLIKEGLINDIPLIVIPKHMSIQIVKI